MRDVITPTIIHQLGQALFAAANFAHAAALAWDGYAPGESEARHWLRQTTEQIARAGDLLGILRRWQACQTMELEPIDLGELLRPAIRAATGGAGAIGIELAAATAPQVLVDRRTMEEVFRDLLRRMTAPSGPAGKPLQVAIGLADADDRAVVVIDGIPPELHAQLERIVTPEPLATIELPAPACRSHQALALLLDRWAIERAGGRIWLEGDAPNWRLCVSFPVVPPADGPTCENDRAVTAMP